MSDLICIKVKILQNDYILTQLPRPADICFTHPPYHDMIAYSGSVYGNEIITGDTSHCRNVGEFISKSQVMLMNVRLVR